ncbi:hypothetical protein PoB_002979500 [Plakobranchus ocellatus]|uniref:Uncharacterized protein n=1 Tax=Plakobranchus ocellatus TaxID=259542 RepID=A0AAV4A7C7_9GAST|nr:hypothetical protein PoB_002979500 [Plakobranchus ocellatus]
MRRIPPRYEKQQFPLAQGNICTDSTNIMKVIIVALCLSLLVAMTLAQTKQSYSLVATCSQLCGQGCNVLHQLLHLFDAFLGDYVDTVFGLCQQMCGMACGYLG